MAAVIPANGSTVPLAFERNRLVSFVSPSIKNYLLPECKHDDDTVYPHNEIKEVNTKLQCISDVQSRNICMRYRM